MHYKDKYKNKFKRLKFYFEKVLLMIIQLLTLILTLLIFFQKSFPY